MPTNPFEGHRIPDIRSKAQEKKEVKSGNLFRWKKVLQIYWAASGTSTGKEEKETWTFPTEAHAVKAFRNWEKNWPGQSISESEKPNTDKEDDKDTPDWVKQANSNNVHDHPKVMKNEAVRTREDAQREMISLAKELVDEVIGAGGKSSGIKKSYRRDAVISLAKHLQANFDAGYAGKTPVEFNPKKFSSVLNQDIDEDTADDLLDSIDTFATHSFVLGQDFAALRRKNESKSLNEAANVLVFDGAMVALALHALTLDQIKRRGPLTGYKIPPKVREALGSSVVMLERFLDKRIHGK